MFGMQLQTWWTKLQPGARDAGEDEESDGLFLGMLLPEATMDWSQVYVHGKNGLFLVLLGLAWWVHVIVGTEQPEDLEWVQKVEWFKWEAMVEDIGKVLKCLMVARK
jgi:hypothetical protein